MKRKFRRPLIGGISLVLTMFWSGMALPEPPALPGDGADPAMRASGFPLFRQADEESAAPPAVGNRPRQDEFSTQSVTRPPVLVAVHQDLLARASFPDSGPVGDARASFLDLRWLSDRRLQLEGGKTAAEDLGGRSGVSGPLSLFLLGTGMFGLASCKRRWKK